MSNKDLTIVIGSVYAAIMGFVLLQGGDVMASVIGAGIVIGILLVSWFLHVWEPQIWGFLMIGAGVVVMIAASLLGSAVSFLPGAGMVASVIALVAVVPALIGGVVVWYSRKNKHNARRLFGKLWLLEGIIISLLTLLVLTNTRATDYSYIVALPILWVLALGMGRFWAISKLDKFLINLYPVTMTAAWLQVSTVTTGIPAIIITVIIAIVFFVPLKDTKISGAVGMVSDIMKPLLSSISKRDYRQAVSALVKKRRNGEMPLEEYRTKKQTLIDESIKIDAGFNIMEFIAEAEKDAQQGFEAQPSSAPEPEPVAVQPVHEEQPEISKTIVKAKVPVSKKETVIEKYVFCEACGKQIRVTAMHCRYCGAEQEPEPEV